MGSKPEKGRPAPCLAVLGTASDVGKSVVATALCRVFARRGLRVAPFKAQNMSNNSGVTPEGLEMGRAQVVQAEAARIAPHVDMNPILLKPTSDRGAQVVILGRVDADAAAAEYHRRKGELFPVACAALDRLRRHADLVIMEGAGSCAEVNLMARDLVNFPMALHAQAPVLLVADIHRGGVFAQLVGTLECIGEALRQRVAGLIVNRFRGDMALFRDGVLWLERRTGKRVLGVLPWFDRFAVPAEDSVVIERPESRLPPLAPDAPAVALIRLPHIANFTDLEPLAALPGLQTRFLEQPRDLSPFRAVVLPGSKNTRADLEWLRRSGWERELAAHAARGGHLLGICGGYQMLGRAVHDPQGLEGAAGSSAGLDLLPVETVLKAPKFTTLSRFSWAGATGEGYEIHMGQSAVHGGQALFRVHARNGEPCCDADGCSARDGRILGTYMHGLFDTPAILQRWLAGIGLPQMVVSACGGRESRDRGYEELADHFERHVDVAAIARLAGLAFHRDGGRRGAAGGSDG
jgi:adenosylcobyric acid synthase